MEAASPISKNYGKSLKKSIHRTFSSTPCENLAPINYQNGILQTPPILYHSFPPFLAHQKQQPPLLPLPIPKTSVHVHQHYNTLSQNRAFSLPPTNRKLKPKKNKSSPKKDQESPKSSKVAMVSSTNPLGPDPKYLPKDVSMVLSMSSTGGKEPSVRALSSDYVRSPKKDDANRNQLSLLQTNSLKESDQFSNSVVFITTVSPPPSSLPLPTFSLRPKLSCNAEASAGVDAGATDNLRRLLRLR